MDVSGNTILITGGATGIGYAIAESFLEAGNEIIICGRREERLLEAQIKHLSVASEKEERGRIYRIAARTI